nr:immunoglobulin heavy chain junction region [Macaca mulatta]MOV53811.1 immunoglobulin heavy chain junction region [Macaca mulatta]MOV54334.1 immunoglobulin heavy chain junction region [Macaca mulatta]MOV54852.1 immunoglobulin heavy chain junction region [Macaca mulatta]MOV55581.1 immunoglobulin heavy chain junction region [Macaca mulatta]
CARVGEDVIAVTNLDYW